MPVYCGEGFGAISLDLPGVVNSHGGKPLRSICPKLFPGLSAKPRHPKKVFRSANNAL